MARNNQLVRQWKLLRCLGNNHFGLTLEELADEFEVTTMTIRRDLKGLAEAGFPIFADTMDDGTKRCKASGKTARGGPEQGDRLRLATDRLDLPPEVVGLIYRCRWQIEIFFRTFKHVLGCRRLLSHSENGIALQTYAAILACLLIALWTGRKPTRRTVEMLQFYFSGWADLDEVEAHIARLAAQDKATA